MSKIIDFQSRKIQKDIENLTTKEDLCKILYDFLESCEGKISVIKMAQKFGFKVYSKNFKEEISGKIYINGSTKEKYGYDKVILVNSKDNKADKRLTVARELSFYLFNIIPNENLSDKKTLIENTYTAGDSEDTYEEVATNILLPDKEFYPIFLKKTRFGRLKSAENYLAEHFQVPKSLVKRKIIGLIKY